MKSKIKKVLLFSSIPTSLIAATSIIAACASQEIPESEIQKNTTPIKFKEPYSNSNNTIDEIMSVIQSPDGINKVFEIDQTRNPGVSYKIESVSIASQQNNIIEVIVIATFNNYNKTNHKYIHYFQCISQEQKILKQTIKQNTDDITASWISDQQNNIGFYKISIDESKINKSWNKEDVIDNLKAIGDELLIINKNNLNINYDLYPYFKDLDFEVIDIIKTLDNKRLVARIKIFKGNEQDNTKVYDFRDITIYEEGVS